jgi:uncharacterized protein (DUF2225 family)
MGALCWADAGGELQGPSFYTLTFIILKKSVAMEEENAYERERQERIKRNQAMLAKLQVRASEKPC